MASSSNVPYKVFISHAGEDKTTIAFPLRDRLMQHQITAFVDEMDMPGGTWSEQAMIRAMETAHIAVVILSPEFVARKWPMKELLCFLRRSEHPLPDGKTLPVIIPIFYRLTIQELYNEPRLDRVDKNEKSLYRASRFFERMENGEPEANIANIKAALNKVHGAMGVENYVQACNDSTTEMLKRRNVLLDDLCKQVRDAVARVFGQINSDTTESKLEKTEFLSCYHAEDDVSDLVLDFREGDENGSATTVEADVLEALLDRSAGTSVISIQGIGGVGKTSILRGLSNLEVVNQRFQDGTHLMRLGADATHNVLVDALCEMVQVSGGTTKADAMRKEKDWKEVFKCFRSWFAERECLFMVDDVWNTAEMTSDVLPELLKLHLSGLNSKVLITTRSTEIASRTEKCFILEPRKPQESQCCAILKLHSGIDIDNSRAEDRGAVTEILRRCSGLPLFLKLAGRAVRALSFNSGSKGSVAYQRYSSTLDVSMQAFLNVAVDSYERLASSFSISVDLLEIRKNIWGFGVEQSAAEMHRRLFVLMRQNRVPMTMLKYLWELRSEAEATVVARDMDHIALATIYVEEDHLGYVELLGVHESLHEYALGETQKHGEERLVHNILLEGYGRGLETEEGCRAWWSRRLEVDGYIHRHICRHLLFAGRERELVKLLLKPEWTIRSFEECGILDVERKYSLGVTVVKKMEGEEHEDQILGDRGATTSSEIEIALQMISEAMKLFSGSHIGSPRELCFQLHGRLKVFVESNDVIKEYLNRLEEKATELLGPWMSCICSFLMSPGGSTKRIRYVGSSLTCMTMKDDGSVIICGCYDGRIIVLDIRSGEVVKQWRAHEEWILNVAFSNSGNWLFSVSHDGIVKVWDSKTWTLSRTFECNVTGLSCFLTMEDGRFVVTDSYTETVQVRDLENGRILLERSQVHDEKVQCMAALRDEEHFVSGGRDKVLRIWSVRSGEQIGEPFSGHESLVTCVAVMPGGRLIISGSDDCSLRIWETEKRPQAGNALRGHAGSVTHIAVGTDGRRVVSASQDKTILVWDILSGREVCNALKGHTNTISGVLLHPDGNSVVSCSYDQTVRFWDLGIKNVVPSLNRHSKRVNDVMFSSNGRYVVSCSWDRSVRIWDAYSGHQIGKPLLGHWDSVRSVALTPDGQRVVSVSDDMTVRVWNLNSHELLHMFTGHTASIRHVALTPTGSHAVTSSHDRTIRVWDLATGGHNHFVLAQCTEDYWPGKVLVSDDGLRVVRVSPTSVSVWNIETRERIKSVDGRDDACWLSRSEVMGLIGESTHESSSCLVRSDEQEIWYDHKDEWILLGTLEARVECLALSPDKKTICAGLIDGQVVFMRLET